MRYMRILCMFLAAAMVAAFLHNLRDGSGREPDFRFRQAGLHRRTVPAMRRGVGSRSGFRDQLLRGA